MSRVLLGALGVGIVAAAAGCYEVAGFGDLEFGEAPVPEASDPIVHLQANPDAKVDLLLVVDNSRSMADKQSLLALAVPDLVQELANPRCLDPEGEAAPVAPTSPLEACPDGMARQFDPVIDMHVGVISSSLGSHGGDVCPAGAANADNDDRARLLTRSANGTVATYEDLGFLAWDPTGRLAPPGETDFAAFGHSLAELVEGVGERGCGFEATLESWYRFLVDPEPPAEVLVHDDLAVVEGVDEVLLAQRADFLRPDSLLLVVMLSDENDCSVIDGGIYYVAAKTQSESSAYHLPASRTPCLDDPTNPCCASCGQPAEPGCLDPDPRCEAPLDATADPTSLRCFDTKRRFGIDFLYPVDRYVDGLTSLRVVNRRGELVTNPVYPPISAEHPEWGYQRDPRMVVLAGIVGVPWQDIARRDGQGRPDLLGGLDDAGLATGGFQSHAERDRLGTWDLILGDPERQVPPGDPLMRESIAPRDGTDPQTGEPLEHPLTGDPIAPPGAGYMENSINGHERSIPDADDLQYACIFPLEVPVDCNGLDSIGCECTDPPGDNPVCQLDDGAYGTTQRHAKVYPGVRQLQVIRDLGPQGVLGSICPAQTDDAARSDFGYRPMMGALLEATSPQLQRDPCLADSQPVSEEGRLDCWLIEARDTGSEPCVCNRTEFRYSVSSECPECEIYVQQIREDPAMAGKACFCAVEQCRGTDLSACQYQNGEPVINTQQGNLVEGWCYVEPAAFLGSPDLVASCPTDRRRRIRFLGEAQPDPSAELFLVCP